MKYYEYCGISYEMASKEANRLITDHGWYRSFDRLSVLREIMKRSVKSVLHEGVAVD